MDVAPIAWMDPNDLLFLQIQGSGKLLIGDDVLRVGYAGQNGHPYTAIGKPLIEQGHIALEDMSMQAIYDWLEGAEENAASNHSIYQCVLCLFQITRRAVLSFAGPSRCWKHTADRRAIVSG